MCVSFQAPVVCEVQTRQCVGGNCILKYSGDQDNIHFMTKETCAGDEIGWDFVNAILTSKISFSAFCQEKSRMYRSINVLSAPFMSKTTFVTWFFSWAGRMDDDFKQEVDPWCSPNPKIVACDGTHVGLSLRKLSINGIESPDTAETVDPPHKRYDRVFLPYRPDLHPDNVRSGRIHLKYMAKKYLSQHDGEEPLQQDDIDARNENLLAVSPQDAKCLTVMRNFLQGTYPPEVKQSLSEIFLMLATDAPVTTLIPYRFLETFEEFCDGVIAGTPTNIHTINFSPEIHRVLTASSRNNLSAEIANFFLYLISFIQEVHSNDGNIVPAQVIGNTYNPESGTAYYFTNHGNKVRQTPSYSLDNRGNRANYDDDPCDEERCRKDYTKVSVGGWCHLFLWFCPVHGHCFGFHIINGAEGRKDPFHSAYSYMEEPPEEVFYDFACSLCEYSLNRQPAFWRNTRFWHDLFHGFRHKCGSNYKSSRILALQGLNTEICEQFNAFIQCIKYTATHLTQAHFCFFVQFMIKQWNKKKTDSFMKKIAIALGGIQD